MCGVAEITNERITNEFGTIPKSSTTHALTSMLHIIWNKQTDVNGSAVRIVLFDFKKSF